jgi:hypothetical protein
MNWHQLNRVCLALVICALVPSLVSCHHGGSSRTVLKKPLAIDLDHISGDGYSAADSDGINWKHKILPGNLRVCLTGVYPAGTTNPFTDPDGASWLDPSETVDSNAMNSIGAGVMLRFERRWAMCPSTVEVIDPNHPYDPWLTPHIIIVKGLTPPITVVQ